MYRIAEDNDFGIIEMEVDKDHINLLVEYNPVQSILEIVRLLKQISTYRIWRQNGNNKILRRHLERTFWSDGYFACSIEQVSKNIMSKPEQLVSVVSSDGYICHYDIQFDK